jgi:hypothetical protein
MHAKVFEDHSDIAARLAGLGPGLTEEVIVYAVSRGEDARLTCNKYDPLTLGGTLAWGRTIRGLREVLCPTFDWELCRAGGLETVVSPDGQVAITVTTGNSDTGRRTSPRSKYRKGIVTQGVVSQNQQLWLFPPEGGDFSASRPQNFSPPDRKTWILLIDSSEEGIYCELSLPVAIDSDGRLGEWAERIILGMIPRDRTLKINPADAEPDVVVEVSKKEAV